MTTVFTIATNGVRGKDSLQIRLAPFKGTPEERKKKMGEMLDWVAIARVPLYEELPPRRLSAVDVEWQPLPESLRAGAPLAEAFERSVREFRSAHERQKLQ